MTDMVTVDYRTSVTVDRAAWESNYGTDPAATADDVRRYVAEVIETSVRDWLERSGNVGTVAAKPEGSPPPILPAPDGRNNLVDVVSVLAHHSGMHDGVNVEIDAPAGVRVTVAINDWDNLDVVIPS